MKKSQPHGEPDLKELDRQILSFVAKAEKGITRLELGKMLSPSFTSEEALLKSRLLALVDEGRIYLWPGRNQQYALVPFVDTVRQKILDTIARKGPQGVKALDKAVEARGKPLRGSVLRQLITEKLVYEHPKCGRRGLVYALTPPDPLAYLATKLRAMVKEQKGRFQDVELARALVRFAVQLDPAVEGEPVNKTRTRDEVLIAALFRVNPKVADGAVIDIAEWRGAVSRDLPAKGDFDAAVLALARSGRLQLQSHDLPADLSEEEKEDLIPNGRGSYFLAAGLRF